MRKIPVILTILIFLGACNSTNETLPKEKPDDFAFSLKYGVTAANEINTYDNTYTKDLVIDGTITTVMTLTNEEMEIFYEKFRDTNVLKLPQEKGGSTCMEPYYRYKLNMTINGEDHNLTWDASCETRAINKWEETMYFLNTEIIFPKEEYKALPKPTGGYD